MPALWIDAAGILHRNGRDGARAGRMGDARLPRRRYEPLEGGLFKARTGPVAQRSRGGALAQREMTIDKARDRYTETVTMLDTGEVIKHCDEPLRQHTEHGSDRPTEPRSR